MKYVIIRDDDTSALTPPAYLDELYRPFLDRHLPVNLGLIPNVNTNATWKDGSPEGFLLTKIGTLPNYLSIETATELLQYLKQNPDYHFAHHGYEHDYLEFMRKDGAEIERRLEAGHKCFANAGLGRLKTFIAPYDQLSTASFRAVSKHFQILSTNTFRLKRLPVGWWPRYFLKQLAKQPHWQVDQLQLLSHPGFLLSYRRDVATMLDSIKAAIESSHLTVLVTHWWEYFPQNQPNPAFISVLHQTAEYLASRSDIQVIPFEHLIDNPELIR